MNITFFRNVRSVEKMLESSKRSTMKLVKLKLQIPNPTRTSIQLALSIFFTESVNNNKRLIVVRVSTLNAGYFSSVVYSKYDLWTIDYQKTSSCEATKSRPLQPGPQYHLGPFTCPRLHGNFLNE